MPTLYLAHQGATLRLDHDRLRIDMPGLPATEWPLAQIDALVVLGQVHLTMPVMRRLLRDGIDASFLTVQGRYCGRLAGPLSPAGPLRRAQYAASLNPPSATAPHPFAIAQACVGGKLRNMRTVLLRYRRAGADAHFDAPGFTDAALSATGLADSALEPAVDPQTTQGPAAYRPAQAALDRAIQHIERRLDQVADCPTTPSLLGLEGSASAAYFGVLPWLLKHDWGFSKRQRRPPPDPVNALLSLGYTLLVRQIEAAIHIVGLDPYIGFLHEPAPGRPALALDLMEEFRCIVADSVVLRCLNGGLITADDFTVDASPTAERPLVLSDRGLKRFVAEFEARLNSEIAHPDSGERVSYRRVFELQVRRLAQVLRNDAQQPSSQNRYRPFVVR